MDYNINIRQNQLENFQQFIDSAKCNLKQIFDTLGWKQELVMKEDHLVSCLYDKAHRVAAKNLQQHLSKCSLKKAGYTDEDILLSEPSCNKKSSILLDHTTKKDLFTKARKQSRAFKSGWNGDEEEPKTADRLISAYTADERLALYNFSVFATDGPKVPLEFDLSQPPKDERELTYEERLEHERNAKRRRAKYKSVHTNKKNHIEVMREVINNQMELYQEYLSTTLKSDNPKKDDQQTSAHAETMNNSFDETRSTTSKHSTHSAESFQSKSRYPSSRSLDRKSKRDNYDYDRPRNGNRKYYKDDYHEERRHSSRERYTKRYEGYSERSRSKSMHRERSRDDRVQRRDYRDHHDEKYERNGTKDRGGYYHRDSKDDSDDRRKRKISGDGYSNDPRVRRSKFS